MVYYSNGIAMNGHNFTLFVIDIHQNVPILLFETPFDHFHFHPNSGLRLTGEDGALFERDRDERAQFHIVCDRYTSEYAQITF